MWLTLTDQRLCNNFAVCTMLIIHPSLFHVILRIGVTSPHKWIYIGSNVVPGAVRLHLEELTVKD